jgi:hypothetical protein
MEDHRQMALNSVYQVKEVLLLKVGRDDSVQFLPDNQGAGVYEFQRP